jgi:hypothetical protein
VGTYTAPGSGKVPWGMLRQEKESPMLVDILIALVIVAIAAALGLTVHPVLWFIVIVAALWLFVRRGRGAAV